MPFSVTAFSDEEVEKRAEKFCAVYMRHIYSSWGYFRIGRHNSHKITLKGQSIKIIMGISSFAAGGITGAYTPYSACGSLKRILGKVFI